MHVDYYIFFDYSVSLFAYGQLTVRKMRRKNSSYVIGFCLFFSSPQYVKLLNGIPISTVALETHLQEQSGEN